jgi:hypothetical protein
MSSTRASLRPLTIGQLLDQAVALYRSRFLLIWLVLAVALLPNIFAGGTSLGGAFSPILAMLRADNAALFEPATNPFATSALSYLLSFIGSATGVLGQGAVIWILARTWLGDPVSLAGVWQEVRQRWMTLFGILIFTLVLTMMAAIWWIVVPIVGWLTGLGILAYISYVIQPLALVVAVGEQRGAWEALQRGWHLARRAFWWSLGVAVLAGLLVAFVSLVPSALVLGGIGALLVWFPSATWLDSGALFLVGGLQGLLMVFVLPIQLAAMVLLWFRLREEQEGLDLVLQLADRSQDGPVERIALVAAAPAPPSDPLTPSGEELWRFFGLSLIPFALIALYVALIVVAMGALVAAIGF